MALSKKMEMELGQFFKWRLKNVPELDGPVLFVLDYSPSTDQPPISIAFDYNGGPKCWLSESQVYQRDGDGPRKCPDYREFVFENRRFYPYSIDALPMNIFEDIEQFKTACRRLYWHAVKAGQS